MASPKIENGYIQLEKEIAIQFTKLYLSPGEMKVLWVIMCKNYFWHKEYDRISYTQLEKMTGLNRWNIRKYLRRLIERKIVLRNGRGQRLEYGLQKDYEQWQPVSELITVIRKPLSKLITVETIIQTDNRPLSKQITEPLSKQIHTKELIKETRQKKCSNETSFEQLWGFFPKRVGKKKATDKFNEIFKKLSSEESEMLIKKMIDALEIQKKSDQWQKEGGKYIPYPEKWLNEERWKDEIQVKKTDESDKIPGQYVKAKELSPEEQKLTEEKMRNWIKSGKEQTSRNTRMTSIKAVFGACYNP